MKLTGRLPLTILILFICLLLGILLRSFIQDYLITPISLVLWLLWRYVESIDQHLYWGLLIVGIMFYIFYRVLQKTHFEEPSLPANSNAALENLHYWRTKILITNDEIEKPNLLKTDLGWMLASFLAARAGGMDKIEAHSALKQGQIPLPGSIYAFLFPVEAHGAHLSIRQVVKAIWQAPQRWILHWSGRDLEQYYRSIQEVLNFMDSIMETKNDND